LGFIILKNKLKEDTIYFISQIKACNLQLKMSTGDSIFTSISVARECCLINQNETLKMIDLEILENNKKALKM
jgi:P-type E1-E2 ATPase